MSDTCKLREANGQPNVPCTHEACVFWRHATGTEDGCAIQYFELLGDAEELPAWLLAIKKRLEDAAEED